MPYSYCIIENNNNVLRTKVKKIRFLNIFKFGIEVSRTPKSFPEQLAIVLSFQMNTIPIIS
jgi:hypothetical protein